MVIFEGHKFYRFLCKLVERKILILEKKQWYKETMYSKLDQRKINRKNPFRQNIHKTFENYQVYDILYGN